MNNDTDVLLIDMKIKKYLNNEVKKLDKYKNQLTLLESELKNKLDYKTKFEYETNYKNLKDKINKLENNYTYNEYISRTSKIIEQYNKIIKTKVQVSFNKQNEESKEKKKLINEFLQISSDYVIVNKKKYSKSPETCRCGSNEISENICIKCGTEFQQYYYHTYDNKDRINNSKKYKYNRNVHFIDVLNQIQGHKIKTIPDNVYTDLEYEFKINHLELDKENRFEKYAKITKDHIRKFLKLHDHSKQYININYLYTYYTGNSCIDLSNIAKVLLSEFEELLKAFDMLVQKGKITGRTSFINSHYVLYQLLYHHNIKCDINDFNISKDKLYEYNSLYSQLCSITKFNICII